MSRFEGYDDDTLEFIRSTHWERERREEAERVMRERDERGKGE